ncbi:NAD(P)H-binding protein [Curtobacterium sp. AB451]|uniref:NAD(P)H-binding protein n=1 Tax=Curtobacterium sp. AB451 TaxID=3422306 RepID=UPI003D34EA95
MRQGRTVLLLAVGQHSSSFSEGTFLSTLLVLGGSGRTGVHVLRQAVARGHRVRALVRNPDTVDAPADVELIEGTPANIDDIRRAAEGADAVVSALNNSRASDNPWASPSARPPS